MIYNDSKTIDDYSSATLFLNSEPGLIDTIHKNYPAIWQLYKEMKSLDWSEDEFDYTQCFNDFKNAPEDVSSMMIETLMWQWEADSIASQFPLVLIAPFNPCTEVIEAETAIMVNELVHANTYSEIVRMSFENPKSVLSELLENQETVKRLTIVDKCLSDFKTFSENYNAKVYDYTEQDVYEQILVYYFTMLCLERIQFMASFAITFTICKSGLFQPIGQAVKKIAQDELEVHSEYRKEIIKEILKHDETNFSGQIYASVEDKLVNIFDTVIENEMTWTEHLFENKSLMGVTESLLKEWILFNAKDVYGFMNRQRKSFTKNYRFPSKNPLSLEDWFNMNSNQPAPQEQDIAAYKVNVISRDDDDVVYDF